MIKSLFLDNNIKKIILIFIATRILFLGIGLYARNTSSLSHGLTGYGYESTFIGKVGTIFYGSDSHWFLKIAEEWYPKADEKTLVSTGTSLVFFPFYPLIVKLFGFVIGNQWSGIIISNLCFLGSGIVLYIALRDRGKDFAFSVIKYMFIFPVSFIFASVLDEPLFLFLFILMFLLLQQRKYLFAGIIGFFMALTRPFGFLAFLPIFFVALPQFKNFKLKEKIKIFFACSLPILGLLVLVIYRKYLSGSYFAIMLAEKGWNKGFSLNFSQIFYFIFGQLSYPIYLINFIIILSLIFFTFYGLTNLNVGYKLMALGVIVISIFTTTQYWHVLSFPRFFAILFPAYIGVGRMGTESKLFDMVATSVFLFFQIVIFSLWVRGFPIPV